MSNPIYGHGRLTPEDRERIEHLADTGLKAARIARQIQRHHAAVRWHLYRLGRVAPDTRRTPQAYWRNGRQVSRFTPYEDALLTQRRCEGWTCEAIAQECTQRFRSRRSRHSVYARLVILARE